MLKRFSLLLLLPLFILGSCKDKTDAIKKEILDGYWSDVDGLTVEFNEGEDDAFVVEFNQSDMRTNPAVFNASTPYIRNIASSGNNTYTAEILQGTFDAQGNLQSATFVPTTITMGKNSSGDKTLTLTNVTPASASWIFRGDAYTPPADPYGTGTGNPTNPGTCDTTTVLTTAGNILSTTGAESYMQHSDQDFPVRSGLIYLGPYVPCNYKLTGKFTHINGSTAEITLILGHKPTASKSFTLSNHEDAVAQYVETDEAALSYAFYYYPEEQPTVDVTVSGGNIIATISNIKLQSWQTTWDGQPMYLTATLVGQ